MPAARTRLLQEFIPTRQSASWCESACAFVERRRLHAEKLMTRSLCCPSGSDGSICFYQSLIKGVLSMSDFIALILEALLADIAVPNLLKSRQEANEA